MAINEFNSRKQGHNDEVKRHTLFQYVKEIVPMHNILCMWNMYETPLYMDMLVKRTIQTKANVRVCLNTGNERKRFL
jgi:hypothetical protein